LDPRSMLTLSLSRVQGHNVPVLVVTLGCCVLTVGLLYISVDWNFAVPKRPEPGPGPGVGVGGA
jgi:hypothetical protein